jgi:hypothetical protein
MGWALENIPTPFCFFIGLWWGELGGGAVPGGRIVCFQGAHPIPLCPICGEVQQFFFVIPNGFAQCQPNPTGDGVLALESVSEFFSFYL